MLPADGSRTSTRQIDDEDCGPGAYLPD
jgi:hypothetical protein